MLHSVRCNRQAELQVSSILTKNLVEEDGYLKTPTEITLNMYSQNFMLTKRDAEHLPAGTLSFCLFQRTMSLHPITIPPLDSTDDIKPSAGRGRN